MFTAAKIRNGATYLGNHLSANDYYAKGETVSGYWVGIGAKELGLVSEVSPEDFEALRTNLRPGTTERLTPLTKGMRQPTLHEAAQAFKNQEGRSGSPVEVANLRLGMKAVSNRVACFDFQCSAPKSVSIMAVLAGDKRLRDAHDGAARIALSELERFASRQKNTQTQRQSEITGNICAAAFTHDASRALDPQLHTHFVVANATYSLSSKWYALNEYEMIKAVRYAGKVYQNELARTVRTLGYDIRIVREKGETTGFEIAGVSDEICQRFSKRREEIEREIEKFKAVHGREPTTKEISLITRETRSANLKEITTSEVHAAQRAQLEPEEWQHLQLLQTEAKRRQPSVKVESSDGREALKASVAHLFERQSVLKEHEILAEALNQSLGALDLDELKSLVRAGEADLVHLVSPSENGLLSECCTHYGLELERWSVSFVNGTKGTCFPLNPDFVPSKRLSSEQADAVKVILGSHDQVFSFRGVAGAGKTTTLKEVQRGLTEAGHPIFAITPTTSAAKVLQSEGFAEATTVEDFLRNGEKRGGLRGAVVICDEAGLKSNRQGAELLRLSRKYGMRVLLVGDIRQHVSVEAGDFLRVLEAHSKIGRCEVGEIHRQVPADYRGAITQMAAGEVREGLRGLDALGWIKEGQFNYLNEAAADYLRLTDHGKALDRCLAVSFTWDENHRFTEAIREGLKEQGALPRSGSVISVHESFRWTEQQKKDWRRYSPGQVVTFTPSSKQAGGFAVVLRVEEQTVVVASTDGKERTLDLRRPSSFDVARARDIEIAVGDKVLVRANDKKRKLINGQVLTVSGITPDGSLQTKEGVSVPADFRQWCHGYVVTSHKAQGWTTDHVVVAAETLTAKGAYVSCSRGRHSCLVHTPDKVRLLDSLPEGNRQSALDALPRTGQAREATALSKRPEAWRRLAVRSVRALSSRSRAWIIQRSIELRRLTARWALHRNRTSKINIQTATPSQKQNQGIKI